MDSPEQHSATEPSSLSFGQRFFLVWAWLFRGLFDGQLAAQLQRAQQEFDRSQGRLPALPEAERRPSLPGPESPTAPAATETTAAAPVDVTAAVAEARRAAASSLLALLQREGRFIDFVQQDIAAFSDADIGAAARLVHSGCRKALTEHVQIQPVANESEGATIRLEKGYDPAAYKLTGNVSGTAPYVGTLRHKGWQASAIELPEPVAGQNSSVLMPAEVEL